MTPACLALDAAGIAYTVHPYIHDSTASSFGDEAVDALGVDADRVFKTLVAQLDTGELVVAIVPVSGKLDLKKLAAAAETKRASMAPLRLAERSSGYVAGGISPFGQRARRRSFVDERALTFDSIFVSGGRRGLDIEVSPQDLVTYLDATISHLS